jgi:hypothetical protein
VQLVATPFVAEARSGLVEAYVGRSLSESGPAILAKIERIGAHRVEAAISFTHALQSDDAAIDFATEFHANSAFALNAWQFQCMYPERDDVHEHLRCRMPPEFSMEELVMHVRFPKEAGIPSRLTFRSGIGREPDIRWRSAAPESILKVESQREVQVRVAFPVPNAVYELSWGLVANRYDGGDEVRARGIARAQALRGKLAALTSGTVPAPLLDLLGRFELNARDFLGIGAATQTQAYDIALYVFDAGSASLRYLAGSFAATDLRSKARYAFGLGTVGRAFKSGEVAAFRRPSAPPSERPWGYVLPDGRPVSADRDVPESAIVAFPLAPLEARDWPFAVLQVSTDDPRIVLKTTNTASDVSIETLAGAAVALAPDLEDILQNA